MNASYIGDLIGCNPFIWFTLVIFDPFSKTRQANREEEEGRQRKRENGMCCFDGGLSKTIENFRAACGRICINRALLTFRFAVLFMAGSNLLHMTSLAGPQ